MEWHRQLGIPAALAVKLTFLNLYVAETGSHQRCMTEQVSKLSLTR